MTTRKPSFFERLTGSIRMTDDDFDFQQNTSRSRPNFFIDQYEEEEFLDSRQPDKRTIPLESDDYTDSENFHTKETVAELSVDVFYDDENIYIQTMTAGVRKEDLEIILSREELVIRGNRDQGDVSYDADYVVSELYWGNFERTISLPDEVDIERARAHESHGLITLTLPKFDKKRQTTLQID